MYDNDQDIIDDYGGGVEMLAHEGMYYTIPKDFEPLPDSSTWQEDQERENRYADSHPVGRAVQMASNGGMDRGSDWWKVYHFVKHDVYVKVSGWYASHDGTHFEDGWDACTEVQPQEEIVIRYTKV